MPYKQPSIKYKILKYDWKDWHYSWHTISPYLPFTVWTNFSKLWFIYIQNMFYFHMHLIETYSCYLLEPVIFNKNFDANFPKIGTS